MFVLVLFAGHYPSCQIEEQMFIFLIFEPIRLVMWSLPIFYPYFHPLYLLLSSLGPSSRWLKAYSMQMILLFSPLPRIH